MVGFSKEVSVEGKTIKVNTKIEFMVVEEIIECRNAVYTHASKSTFNVMRMQMEQDISIGEYWSFENLENRNVNGCEKYGEFTSKELARIFCDALNNKTQDALIEISMTDNYKACLS